MLRANVSKNSNVSEYTRVIIITWCRMFEVANAFKSLSSFLLLLEISAL